MTIDDIAKYYQTCFSIRKTSRDLEVNYGTVRKALISRGLWTSPRVEEIAKLREQGCSTEEICEKLNISESCVASNSPYKRDTYLNETKSKNALRIKAWREKRKKMDKKRLR